MHDVMLFDVCVSSSKIVGWGLRAAEERFEN